jgi:predicted DNA-binding protein (MmcQ/YjbR family)
MLPGAYFIIFNACLRISTIKFIIFVLNNLFNEMNIEEFRTYCLSRPGVTESLPFGPDTLVYKVLGKIFALAPLDDDFSINLKCDPELAVELRERYNCVQPGYHMNKKMWNTIYMDGSISDKMLCEWIDHSYNEVVKNLPLKQQHTLKLL